MSFFPIVDVPIVVCSSKMDHPIVYVGEKFILAVLVDVITLKMERKPVKLPMENPAGSAREGIQSKGN